MTGPSVLRQLEDGAYTGFRKSLLRAKGSLRQREFLVAVRDGGAFEKLLGELPVESGEDAPLAAAPMTESEYKDPPTDTEQELYRSWRGLPPGVACRSTFWAYVTLQHVRQRRIESVYLAANGGNLSGGAERIDVALRDRAAGQIDSCVRTVLRRLGGLPDVRGNRSVYVDCPFARAWWRERLVEEAVEAGAEGGAVAARKMRKVVRISQSYWEKFIDRVVVRNSTLGSSNIRSAFLRALAQLVALNPRSPAAEVKGLQRLCRRAAAYQGARELSILNGAELDALMASVVQTG